MSSSEFQLSFDGPVAELVLSRAEAMNTLTDRFWGELSSALEAVDRRSDVRVLILRAQGKHFCAGMDLEFFDEVRSREGEESGRYREWLRRKILYLQRPMAQLEALRIPVVAAVQGACIGAGLDLICAADIRLCTADAFFCIHEVNVAITADLGVLQRLPLLIAPSVVQEMALTGRRMGADEASARGLVCNVTPDIEGLAESADAIARQLSARSPLALLGVKNALLRPRRAAVTAELDYMSAWNAAMFVTDDVPAAIDAQKRRSEVTFEDLLS